MKFTSRDLQDLMEVIDQRVERRLARQPRIEYGLVAAISGSTASVNVAGNANASDGFRIAPRLSLKAGDLVRVVIDPDGDRWIADSLTDGAVMPEWTPTDATTPGGDYPGGISMFTINSTTGGWPTSFGTAVTFHETDARMAQMVYSHSGPSIYMRTYHTINDGWSGWQQVYPVESVPGDVTIGGDITSYGGDVGTSYTPTVAGGGTATFTSLSGSYYRVGKMVFVRIYLVVGAAGSGSSFVSITTPTSPKRSGMRQVLSGNSEGLGVGSVTLVAFDSGSGAVWDRLRASTGASVVGSDLTAGTIINIQGWYEEV